MRSPARLAVSVSTITAATVIQLRELLSGTLDGRAAAPGFRQFEGGVHQRGRFATYARSCGKPGSAAEAEQRCVGVGTSRDEVGDDLGSDMGEGDAIAAVAERVVRARRIGGRADER